MTPMTSVLSHPAPDATPTTGSEDLIRQIEELQRQNARLERDLADATARLAALRAGAPATPERRLPVGADHDRDLLLQRVTEDMQDIFWIAHLSWSTAGPSFTVTFASRAVETITGYTAEEVYADPNIWLRITHPDDVATVLAALQASLTSGIDIEYRITHKHGSTRHVQTRIHPLRDAHGDPVELVGLTSDITRRYTAEAWLRFHGSLLDAIGQAVIAIEPGGTIVYWNQAAVATFGWTRAEALGTSVARLGETLGGSINVLDLIARIMHDGCWGAELVWTRKDGAEVPVLANGRLFHNEQGAIAFIVIIATDISEQKRIEAALRRSEAEYRQLNTELESRVHQRTADLRRANDMLACEIAERKTAEEQLRFQAKLLAAVGQAVIAINTNREIIYWSDSATRMFGWNATEISRRNSDFLVASQLDQATREAIEAAVASERNWEGELTMWRRDGSMFPAYATIAPIYDGHEQPAGLIGVISDITERQRVKQALAEANARLSALNADLQQSRDLLRTIFDGLDDALALIDRNGTLLLANQRFAELFQKTPTALVGRACETACPLVAPVVARTLSERSTIAEQARYISASGATMMLHIHSMPLLDGDNVRQVVLRIVDITEQLQIEEIVLQNERLAAIGRMAAIVAHEVNTPLQSIQNYLYLARTTDSVRQAGYLALISDEIDRVSNLIRRLLDVQHPDGSALGSTDCNAVIERVLLLLGSALARNNICVERDLATELPAFRGERDKLTQVLLNLITNAIDAMPHGGVLRLTTRLFSASQMESAGTPAGRYVQMLIEDTGAGIPPDLQSHIFEPFFTTKTQGSGLGLAISQQIIAQQGGRIDVRSAPGAGATFIITLPAIDMPPPSWYEESR